MKLKQTIKTILAKKRNPNTPNHMDFITKDADKLAAWEKKKLNEKLIKAGMDGNGRFVKIDHAISKLHEVLESEGFEMDDVANSHRFKEDDGTTTFNIARQTNDPFSPTSIKNSMVSFSWHLMGNQSEDKSKRKYEIVSYLS